MAAWTSLAHSTVAETLQLTHALPTSNQALASPGDGGWILVWDFFESAAAKMSGGGSSPLSILHSKAYRHWMYCFFRELAALLDVPTFRLVASSRHFLFLLTCTTKQEALNSKSQLYLLQEEKSSLPSSHRECSEG